MFCPLVSFIYPPLPSFQICLSAGRHSLFAYFPFSFFNVNFPSADTLHTSLGPFSFPLCISLILLLMNLVSSRVTKCQVEI